MGALHAGHVALVEEPRRQADRVVASFSSTRSSSAPARTSTAIRGRRKEDARALDRAGCDLLWIPTTEQMYPAGFATTVSVSGLSERWEGEARPGHFDGVATS
jgi:pantoate--beta-alanine ligase